MNEVEWESDTHL